jgi:hypothetical protein
MLDVGYQTQMVVFLPLDGAGALPTAIRAVSARLGVRVDWRDTCERLEPLPCVLDVICKILNEEAHLLAVAEYKVGLPRSDALHASEKFRIDA